MLHIRIMHCQQFTLKYIKIAYKIVQSTPVLSPGSMSLHYSEFVSNKHSIVPSVSGPSVADGLRNNVHVGPPSYGRCIQNHIVVYVLALFWRPLWPKGPRQPPRLPKCSACTDQAMLFEVTPACTAPSMNYWTEKDTDWQKPRWFLVLHIFNFGGVALKFGSHVTAWPHPIGGMEGGWRGSGSWYRGNSE